MNKKERESIIRLAEIARAEMARINRYLDAMFEELSMTGAID